MLNENKEHEIEVVRYYFQVFVAQFIILQQITIGEMQFKVFGDFPPIHSVEVTGEKESVKPAVVRRKILDFFLVILNFSSAQSEKGLNVRLAAR